MSLTASIKFVQGANIGTPGIALLAIPADGFVVVASNGDNSNVVRWTWTMLAVPGGSAVPIGLISDGAFPTATFNYDVAGCYHVELIVTDLSGNQSKDRRVFGVLEASGHLIPPFDAEAPALNFGGQLRGWAKYMEQWLRLLDSLGGTPFPIELSFAAAEQQTTSNTFVRMGARQIDMSKYPATVGPFTRTVKFVFDADMTAGAATAEAKLFDLTNNVDVTGTDLTTPSLTNVEITSAALTVGAAAGNIRNDAPTQYVVYARMNGGGMTDSISLTNARVLITYS